MIQKNYILFVLCLTLGMISCGPADVPVRNLTGDSGINYEDSRKAWEKLKKQKGESYEYVIGETSWTGSGSRTTLVITDGRVTQRKYEAYTRDENTGEETITGSYVETETELGSHYEGAEPVTIDQLYGTCTQFLSVDPSTNTIYFETDEAGILSLCGYVPENCMDDCFTGIRINHFSWR